LMPPTVDIAAHTFERLARNVNCTVRRIVPVLPSVTADFRNGRSTPPIGSHRVARSPTNQALWHCELR
jgi:hypothetical protein